MIPEYVTGKYHMECIGRMLDTMKDIRKRTVSREVYAYMILRKNQEIERLTQRIEELEKCSKNS